MMLWHCEMVTTLFSQIRTISMEWKICGGWSAVVPPPLMVYGRFVLCHDFRSQEQRWISQIESMCALIAWEMRHSQWEWMGAFGWGSIESMEMKRRPSHIWFCWNLLFFYLMFIYIQRIQKFANFISFLCVNISIAYIIYVYKLKCNTLFNTRHHVRLVNVNQYKYYLFIFCFFFFVISMFIWGVWCNRVYAICM